MSIILENISFEYKEKNGNLTKVFQSFSLAIPTGKITSIVGTSGSGKSTLVKLICGLLTPQKGTIKIDGESPLRSQQKGAFGIVFQSPDLLPWRNLFRNIILPDELQRKTIDKERAHYLIRELELGDSEDKYPFQLSGGMQQRASIARALITSPAILLLDEPFSQLDEILRYELLLYVQHYAERNASTVIFVTHDISEAVLVSDAVVVLPSKPVSFSEQITIDLNRPRSMDTASHPRYIDLVSRVRKSLLKTRSVR